MTKPEKPTEPEGEDCRPKKPEPAPNFVDTGGSPPPPPPPPG